MEREDGKGSPTRTKVVVQPIRRGCSPFPDTPPPPLPSQILVDTKADVEITKLRKLRKHRCAALAEEASAVVSAWKALFKNETRTVPGAGPAPAPAPGPTTDSLAALVAAREGAISLLSRALREGLSSDEGSSLLAAGGDSEECWDAVDVVANLLLEAVEQESSSRVQLAPRVIGLPPPLLPPPL